EPGGFLAALGAALGVAAEAEQVVTAMVGRLGGMPSNRAVSIWFELHLRGSLSETDAISLALLARGGGERSIRVLASCRDKDHLVAARAARAYRLACQVIEIPPVDIGQLVLCLQTWTYAATENHFVWSRDALLLACDALLQSEQPITLLRIEILAGNSVYLAANAAMRLLTSWCVSGALEHPERIERKGEISKPWRRRPSAWPPQDLLAKLGELRLRWPTVGRESVTESVGGSS
ncbi:MAG: hypothetical protein AAGC55_20080, partial [Myxococcota bacterium]